MEKPFFAIGRFFLLEKIILQSRAMSRACGDLLSFVVAHPFYGFRPQKINFVYGCRTPASRKGQKHWKVASSLAARLLLIISLLELLLFGILNFLLLFGGDTVNFALVIYLAEKNWSKQPVLSMQIACSVFVTP